MNTVRCELERCYIIGGRIKEGCVRTLYLGVPEPREDSRFVGSMWFNEKLLAFRRKWCKARISGNTLEVLNKRGEVVASIPESDLQCVSQALSGRCEVMVGGWLAPTFEKYDSQTIRNSIASSRKTIRLIGEGKKLPFHDNSPFYQVDPSLQGRIVTLYRLGYKIDAVVFDSRGRIIPHRVAHPLHYPKGIFEGILGLWEHWRL